MISEFMLTHFEALAPEVDSLTVHYKGRVSVSVIDGAEFRALLEDARELRSIEDRVRAVGSRIQQMTDQLGCIIHTLGRPEEAAGISTPSPESSSLSAPSKE